jgi:hypothetical protein
MSHATGRAPMVDSGVRCISVTYATGGQGVGTTADVYGC